MTTEEIKKNATKIFNAVKSALADARKYNKEKGLALGINTWGRKSQVIDLEVWDDTTWDNSGHRIVKGYNIKMNNSQLCSVRTHYDIAEIFGELRRMLDAQKKVKGWSGLNYSNERVGLSSGTWSDYEVSIIPKVCLADNVCNEYKSLANYINKYGKTNYRGSTYGGAVKLGNYELFSAAMGGKRGVLWDEYGERIFLDNKPKKCARLLEELRKARGAKDTMICEWGEENYMDEEERRYSAYHEVECEGEKRKYLHIIIKTPAGKVKYDAKIY